MPETQNISPTKKESRSKLLETQHLKKSKVQIISKMPAKKDSVQDLRRSVTDHPIKKSDITLAENKHASANLQIIKVSH